MTTDTPVSAVTPEGIQYTLRPAGLVARGAAYAIDELIQTVLFIVPLTISTLAAGRAFSWFFFLAGFGITWFYYTSFEVFWNGRSPGKRALGLRVVMANGAPITPSASILRNIVRFADEFLGLATVGFVSVIMSPGFRRLGDWTASTMVVYEKGDTEAEKLSSRQPWLTGRNPMRTDRPLSAVEKQNILAFSSRYPRLGRERADEIARILVPSVTSDPKAHEYPSDYLLSVASGMIGSDLIDGDEDGS